MSAVVLESEEFAYLLSVVHAKSMAGIKDSALFPSDAKAREKTYTKGLELMKEHGWIKPAEKPSQFHFNDILYLMAAIVANPEFVMFTIRNTKSLGRQVIMHYMAGADIIELVATADKKYNLGIISDRATLFERIKSVLGLQFEKQNLQLQFRTEEHIINEIKDMVVKGQRQKAVEILENLGLGGLSVDSLLDALSETEISELEVFKAEKGQVTTGRRATLFQSKDIVWLIKKLDAVSTTLSVETIQADTLPNTFDSFLHSLTQ